MSNSEIEITKSTLDQILEYGAWFVLLLCFMLAAYYYPSLPDKIPTHFSAAGIADAYGSKNQLWGVLAIGFFTMLIMQVASKYPQYGNYGLSTQAKDMKPYYNLAVSLMIRLNMLIAILFLYILYGMLQVALEYQSTLSPIGLWLLIGLMLVLIAQHIYKQSTL